MSKLSAKEQDLLQRVDEKEELRPLFLRKVKGAKWFEHLDSRGYFNPDQNPIPVNVSEEGHVKIPHWTAVDYLIRTAPTLSEEENKDLVVKFLEIIVNSTNFAKDSGFSNYRTWWQFSELLSRLPYRHITTDHVDLIDYWLDDIFERSLVADEIGKWLAHLLEIGDEHSSQLAVRVIEILFKVDFEDQDFGESVRKDSKLRTEYYYADKIIERTTRLAGEKLGQTAITIFDNQLKNILNELSNDSWSAIWQPAIENHEQNKHKNDAENLLICAYRNALDGFMASKPVEAKEHIKVMMECEYQTIRRLAIYTIDKYYPLCSDFIDELLKEEYFGSNYRHELWHLLNRNYQNFSVEQKQKVLEIISNIDKTDDDGNAHEAATFYHQAIWLSAIKDHGKEETKLYNDNVGMAKAVPEHPDFSSYISVGWGGRKSPVSVEELQSYTIEEVVDFLASFQDSGGLREPGIEGLSRGFKQTVKTDPLKFYSQLHKFIDLDFAYIYSIIEAYRDLWSDKNQLPWDDIWPCLFGFCSEVISQDRFWDIPNREQREHFVATPFWIVSSIGRLIESGTKSDDHAFNEKYLKDAEDILTLLLTKEEGDEFKENSDAVSLSINSPRGHCLEALINTSLRCCRLADKKNNKNHSEAWAHFQPIYDAELLRADAEKPEYEFATLVTNYLPNFLYMSWDWVTGNLGKIFDQENYLRWLCAIQGYSYIGTVYQKIFSYLKENGDLIKALDDENIRERVDERVIQNIAVAYINNFEKLSEEGSLINALLVRNKNNELGQLIWFLWTLRKRSDENLRGKVFELWPRLLDQIDFSEKEGRKLASKLCTWADFVNHFDKDNINWLLTIAPYASEEFNAYHLFESLARISKSQPFETHTVWMKIIEAADVYDYPEEAFRQFFKNLVRKGHEGLRKAKEVVSVYISKGNERPSIWLNEVRQEIQENHDPS
ncbi:MAG: hypothetical protein K0B09_11120 [Bacteroidales bacterium]|nr:hypothetical protein [Bacteroidales bacterium]